MSVRLSKLMRLNIFPAEMAAGIDFQEDCMGLLVPGLKKDTSFTDGRSVPPEQTTGSVFNPPVDELDPGFDFEALSGNVGSACSTEDAGRPPV